MTSFRLPLAGARALLALSTAALGSSCVASAQYDEALDRAKYYEQRYYELEAEDAALRDEVERLRRQVGLKTTDLQNASAEIDQLMQKRMSELDKIMSELGANPGDATKFRVDGGYVYRVKEAILFALGSSEVSSEGREILGRIAAEVKADARGRVYVRGHTDNVPIAKPETKKRYPLGNLQLSADRALNVAHALTGSGLAQERVVVMGFGPNEPVVANDSVANRQKNRRVEIFVATDEKEGLGGR